MLACCVLSLRASCHRPRWRVAHALVLHLPLLPPETLQRAPVDCRLPRCEISLPQAVKPIAIVLLALLWLVHVSAAVEDALLRLQLPVRAQRGAIRDAATLSQCFTVSLTRMRGLWEVALDARLEM